MIRGPILPQLREGLWGVVSNRLTNLEHGLTLIMEGLDCSAGQLGAIDGLARDAAGAPVLVVLALDGDSLLLARVLSAVDFAARVGDALAAAVPEANFCPGSTARVLVVGNESARSSLDQVARLPVSGLQVCRLEPFRLGGSERFAVTWLASGAPAASAASSQPVVPGFAVAALRQKDWLELLDLCQRIDPSVRFDGDRHWQRITWNGRALGEVWSEGDALFGATPATTRRVLITPSDLRHFTDQVLRAYALAAGLAELTTKSPIAEPAPAPDRTAAPRHAAIGRGIPPVGAESLRSVLATMRLSPEEYSALGSSALSAGEPAEPAALAGESAKTAAAGLPRPAS